MKVVQKLFFDKLVWTQLLSMIRRKLDWVFIYYLLLELFLFVSPANPTIGVTAVIYVPAYHQTALVYW